jgi:hypothetical protein
MKEAGMRVAARAPLVGVLLLSLLWALAGPASAGFGQATHVLWSRTGGQAGANFGWAVSELADVDGDGVQDAIVSAILDGPSNNGAVFVFSGATGNQLYEFHGAAGDLLGYSIADAGDVNDDGVHDIAAGARGGNRVMVFSGATGSATPLLTLNGEAAGDWFGFAVAGVGDVNGDDHDDVLVGATRNDASGLDSGRAYVFSGANGSTIRTLNADAPGDHFGSATDGIADIDNDGVGDLLVGARDAGKAHDGRVYAFSGADGHRIWRTVRDKASRDLGWFFVAGIDDVNGDGTPDVYGGDFTYSVGGVNRGRVQLFSGVDGSVLRTITGSGEKQGMGPGREAGDVDGDGVGDVVVGSYLSSDGVKAGGKAEVFSGATGDRLRLITSTTKGENFGFDAIGLGDTNGDGAKDLLVSAATGEAVYLISGGA